MDVSYSKVTINQQLLHQVVALVHDLGERARYYFALVEQGKGNIWTSQKSDNSPLSQADTELDAALQKCLQQLTPGIAVISEETPTQAYAVRSGWRRVWLVDPLDGTRHFLVGKPDYTINVALVEDGFPQLGVIYAPSRRRCYAAVVGGGAWLLLDNQTGKKRLTSAKEPKKWLDVMVSHGIPGSRLRCFLGGLPGWQLLPLGSSLKSCWIAEGLADMYPRFGGTYEWDTAAAQVILHEAGGRIVDPYGQPLRYNKAHLLNPEFIACARWYVPPKWQQFAYIV